MYTDCAIANESGPVGFPSTAVRGPQMTKRKTRVRSHVIADMSLHHLAYIVVSCTFTVEPTRTDYGYDLSIFTFDAAGQYENGHLFVQLKATDKLRIDAKTRDIKYRISRRDILTWQGEPFPAYLVVFDAARGQAYSIYLQRYFVKIGLSSDLMVRQSLEVRLPNKVVDEATVRGWRDDKNTVLKQMGAVTHV
jgi:hypothetical protein